MPISAAAMDGIRSNGHRWKMTITGLKRYTEVLGRANDAANEGLDYDRKANEVAVQGIVKVVRAFAENEAAAKDVEMERDLLSNADDLECVEDDAIEEINWAMNQLYDSFDYHRILVA